MVHQSGLQLPKKALPNKESSTYTNEKLWRIRNYHKHWFDPGWEDGRYCRCHGKVRNAKSIKDAYILDVVRIDKKKHYIRSMFQISQFEQCIHPEYSHEPDEHDLRFSCYFFAPEQTRKVIRVQQFASLKNYNGVQSKKLKDEKLARHIIERIKRNYQHLIANRESIPRKVDRDLWDAMVKKAEQERNHQSGKCFTCS